MNLSNQKRIAARILKVGESRVWMDSTKMSEVKEAVTKNDIRSLISEGIIKAKPVTGVSRGRARKRMTQRQKGRQTQTASRKGKRTARLPRKKAWILKTRIQRKFLKDLKGTQKIEP